MTKEEIHKKVIGLKNEEEINDFVNERLRELENNSIEKTVGQNYTDCFQDFISQKTHYKAGDFNSGEECPDLVYDDLSPYIDLIKEIKKRNDYNELSLFQIIYQLIRDYLPNDDLVNRYVAYASNVDNKVSIKTIKKGRCAFCSEYSGLAHNLFKFLGIDSELVCGSRDKELHAYNFVYPNGYGNEPVVIYDMSFFLQFKKDGIKKELAFYKALSKADFELFKTGIPMELDLSKTEETYRKFYGHQLEGFDLEYEKAPIYVYGLDNAKKYKKSGLVK